MNATVNPTAPNASPGVAVTKAGPGRASRPAAAAKTQTPATKERTPAFPLTAKIEVVATANPKRPGTKAAEKWGFYKGCKTVEDVVKVFAKNDLPRRKAMSAIRWDSEHGHITVTAG